MNKNKLTKKDYDFIRQHVGLSNWKLAKTLGCDSKTIGRLRLTFGMVRREPGAAGEERMKTKCECGCNRDAKWLLTFYDPTIPSNAVDLPACDAYKRYIAGCCAELELDFSKKLIEDK